MRQLPQRGHFCALPSTNHTTIHLATHACTPSSYPAIRQPTRISRASELVCAARKLCSADLLLLSTCCWFLNNFITPPIHAACVTMLRHPCCAMGLADLQHRLATHPTPHHTQPSKQHSDVTQPHGRPNMAVKAPLQTHRHTNAHTLLRAQVAPRQGCSK